MPYFFCHLKKGNNMKRIDTSIDGYRYVGINLTEQQYEDLCDLNILLITNKHRKNIPVFNMMLVLKILGLLPPEMVNKECTDSGNNNSNENFKEKFYRKFGRPRNGFSDFVRGKSYVLHTRKS